MMPGWPNDYTDFNNEAAELLEETAPYNPVIVSFSEVMKAQTCKRAWYYNFGLRLKSVQESEALATGNKGHKLLQNFYQFMSMGNNKEEAIRLVTAEAGKHLNANRFADKTLLSAWTLVDNYIRATDFTTENLFVEHRFLIPVSKFAPDPLVARYGLKDVLIGFTPDLVVKRKGNKVDVEDAKFVQRAWSEKKKSMCPQARLYQIFLESMGYEVSRSLLRFFNVTTGKIDEKPYVLTPVSRQILISDFLDGVFDTLRLRTLGKSFYATTLDAVPRTMNYTACQFCDYAFVCGLQAEGKDASNTIKTEFVVNDYDYAK